MNMLDAHIPRLVATQAAFAAKAGLMRHTVVQAEQAALSAQAFHLVEAATAFQSAHARFVGAADYQSMASSQEANTMAMIARGQAEAAKCGG